jgi:hypothetical protein
LASTVALQQLPAVLSFKALHDELQGNASMHYPPQGQPILMDCMQSTDMQIAQAVLMSNQVKQGTGPTMYWLVPVRQPAKFMSLLADFRVVHRSTEGAGKDFLLLANVPCHKAVCLHSVVASSATSLQMPMSWVLEPPVDSSPHQHSRSMMCKKPIEVCLLSVE